MNKEKQIIQSLNIGNRTISPDHPTYIIAEIGINHNGDPEIAKKLIDIAADAKVDGVKLQKRHLPSLYQNDVLEKTEKYEQYFQYMIPILQETELKEDKVEELKCYAEKHGLEFLCTPFDKISADFLYDLGVNAFKVASADLTNLDLLNHIADKGKPMLVSTGMSYPEEIEMAVDVLNKKEIPFALLHCRSVYPVWPREVNLKMINQLSQYGCPVGYSGHDIGITIPLVAASMGACIIEKHITLDKNMRGPDHKISLLPHELKRLVRDIRIADQAMGKSRRFLLRGEILNRELFGKSLIASVDIPSGTMITREMVKIQGPGKGLSPNRIDDLVGKLVSRDLNRGDYFQSEDVDGSREADFSNSFKSRWGLISRFSDFKEMLIYNPKVIEFHLAEKDFSLGFDTNERHFQELVVHAPEYIGDRLLDLCSEDEEIRHKSIKIVQKTINLAGSLSSHFQGTPKVIVHPGAMSLNKKLESAPLHDALIESLKLIKCRGIELLLENLPPYPWYFGGQWKGNYFMDADEIRSFCEKTGINICFDLSHAALYCNAKEKDLGNFIQTIKPFIRHVHFADAYGLDGEGVQIGEGDIALNRVMPLFEDYEDSWVPEIWRGHLHKGKDFIKALNRLKQYQL